MASLDYVLSPNTSGRIAPPSFGTLTNCVYRRREVLHAICSLPQEPAQAAANVLEI